MRVRTNRSTSKPNAPSSRRTSRLRPSARVNSRRLRVLLVARIRARSAFKCSPLSRTPWTNRAAREGVTGPATVASYTFRTP